jgi:hypothetical protein
LIDENPGASRDLIAGLFHMEVSKNRAAYTDAILEGVPVEVLEDIVSNTKPRLPN